MHVMWTVVARMIAEFVGTMIAMFVAGMITAWLFINRKRKIGGRW